MGGADHGAAPDRDCPYDTKASSVRGYRIRGFEDDDVEAIVAGSNAFNADSNLYPRLTGDRLRELLARMDPAARFAGTGSP